MIVLWSPPLSFVFQVLYFSISEFPFSSYISCFFAETFCVFFCFKHVHNFLLKHVSMTTLKSSDNSDMFVPLMLASVVVSVHSVWMSYLVLGMTKISIATCIFLCCISWLWIAFDPLFSVGFFSYWSRGEGRPPPLIWGAGGSLASMDTWVTAGVGESSASHLSPSNSTPAGWAKKPYYCGSHSSLTKLIPSYTVVYPSAWLSGLMEWVGVWISSVRGTEEIEGGKAA